MTLNEKIHKLRKDKGMSLAELAFKTDSTIEQIISFESKGVIINGYKLLQILNALEISIEEFKNI